MSSIPRRKVMHTQAVVTPAVIDTVYRGVQRLGERERLFRSLLARACVCVSSDPQVIAETAVSSSRNSS